MSTDSPTIIPSELLRAARSGNSEELGRLLQAVRWHLLLLAERELDSKLRVRVSASDIVQETMLDAHRDFHQFRGESIGEFLRWIRKILIHNLARSVETHALAEKRSLKREMSLDALSQSVEKSATRLERLLTVRGESPSSTVRRQERILAMSEALALLPADQRRVVIFRNLEGRKFSEIAVEMDRTVGACRMLWFRAINALRIRLRDD